MQNTFSLFVGARTSIRSVDKNAAHFFFRGNILYYGDGEAGLTTQFTKQFRRFITDVSVNDRRPVTLRYLFWFFAHKMIG